MRTIIIAAVAIATAGSAFADQEIHGQARVIDGDTLAIGKEHVRLLDIDAPELDQTCGLNDHGGTYACGRYAKQTLHDLINGQTVHCTTTKKDKYQRWLAICSTHEIDDLGRQMVRIGWALVPALYSTKYYYYQDAAKKEHLGVWSYGTTIQNPWEWRKQHAKPVSLSK